MTAVVNQISLFSVAVGACPARPPAATGPFSGEAGRTARRPASPGPFARGASPSCPPAAAGAPGPIVGSAGTGCAVPGPGRRAPANPAAGVADGPGGAPVDPTSTTSERIPPRSAVAAGTAALPVPAPASAQTQFSVGLRLAETSHLGALTAVAAADAGCRGHGTRQLGPSCSSTRRGVLSARRVRRVGEQGGPSSASQPYLPAGRPSARGGLHHATPAVPAAGRGLGRPPHQT